MKMYYLALFLFCCGYSLAAQQAAAPTWKKKEMSSQEMPSVKPAEATIERWTPRVSPADSTVFSKRTIRWIHDPKRKRAMWAKK